MNLGGATGSCELDVCGFSNVNAYNAQKSVVLGDDELRDLQLLTMARAFDGKRTVSFAEVQKTLQLSITNDMLVEMLFSLSCRGLVSTFPFRFLINQSEGEITITQNDVVEYTDDALRRTEEILGAFQRRLESTSSDSYE